MKTMPRIRMPVGRTQSQTRGEIEAAVSDAMNRFERECMGRGPEEVHAHLIGDLLVVRLRGLLTGAEQELIKSSPPERGRDLLKQVRTHLIEAARPRLAAVIQEITGVEALSMHHDISTTIDEAVVLLTLASPPAYREAKQR